MFVPSLAFVAMSNLPVTNSLEKSTAAQTMLLTSKAEAGRKHAINKESDSQDVRIKEFKLKENT